MGNYYSDAIAVLFDSKTDFRTLASEIAKKNPKAIVDAAARLATQVMSDAWVKECTALMRAGKKIDAIKLCRNTTGMTLVDSKNAVEALVLS